MENLHMLTNRLKDCSKLVLFTCLVFSFISCSKKQPQNILKDIEVKTELVESDVYIKMAATFNFGFMTMTAIDLPIMNPEDPSIVYGRVSFLPTVEKYSEIGISLNISELADVPGGEATLPNGSAIPLVGLDPEKVVQLHIIKEDSSVSNSKVYLSLAKDALFMGFAISIKEFDEVQKYIGMANIFFGFEIDPVWGSVGLYTGDTKQESGLGLFLDLSKVIPDGLLDAILKGETLDAQEFAEAQATPKSLKSRISYKKKGSKKMVEKARKGVMKMARKYKKLTPVP